MDRRTPKRYWKLGLWLGAISAFGFTAIGWAAPASAQISTAFDLGGLGTRSPVEIALSLINWMLGILALIAVVLILYGGFLWLTSRGEEEQIEKAKRVLINAGIGLLIILAAWGIVLYILEILLGATGTGGTNGTSGGGYGGGFPSGGSTFYVRNVDPGDEDVDVTLCTDIYHLFSKDIDTSSVTTNTASSANPTFYLRLVDSTHYTDKAGAGEACAANTDCSSALCDSGTLTCTGDNVSGTIELDDLDAGETTDHFSFLPTVNFEADATYTGTVVGADSGVISEESTGALTMDQDYTYTFVTGSTTDSTPPTVDEVSGESPFPGEAETDVCLNTPINFQFSEAIRTYTVDDNTSFLVSADSSFGTPVALRSFDFGGDRVYAMTRPSSALTANSAYYSELYGGDVSATTGSLEHVITDACGNPLDGDFDGTSEGAASDNYFSPGYDATGDGSADDPLNWTTGENAECIPLITGIDPTNEYYGYGDDPTTTPDDSDSSSIAFTGEYLSPNPEVIFNDTIYSSASDLSCFDQALPPDQETVCFLSASSAEDDTKLPVGAQDGEVVISVADESSSCLFDADGDGTMSCDFSVDSPFIDYVNPHDSAPGDYVTLGGAHFGSAQGTVYFRADEETVAAGYPAYVAADLPDACGDTWSDDQIVVVVPDDYPVDTDLDVQVETEDGHWSNLSYFSVSDTERPSLCQMDPECNDAGAQQSTLTGKKLGTSGIVYYGTGVGTSSAWTSTSIKATSPGDLTDGTYYVSVEVDGSTSNGLRYSVPCDTTDTSGSPPGNSEFYVVTTDPEDDETDVTLCTDIYTQLSDEIDISTATDSNFSLEVSGGAASGAGCTQNSDCASAVCSGGACSGDSVSGSIELDASASTDGTEHFSFLPSTDFEANTTYVGTIAGGSAGLLASDGTAMDDDGYVFYFTTGSTTDTTPPTVTETSSSPYPADGATDICLYTAIGFRFSEAMRTYTFDDSNSFLVSSDSAFGSAALVNLHSFTFGATRVTATTRPVSALTADSTYYSRLHGGDLQSDGSYDNVVTDACGNPLDGNYDGAIDGAALDNYLSSANADQPINWDTGEDLDCTPLINSISPTSGYYGESSLTDDYLTITGQNLSPAPEIVFYRNIFSEEGLDACFDSSTPQTIANDCFDSSNSGDGTILTKIPVGSTDGSVSVTVAGESSTCNFDADDDGSTSCQVTVRSPHIDSVSPSDAAAGDYITIHGTNFGSSTGTVYFVASDGTSVVAELPSATCGDTWSATQIVVIVPSDFAVDTDVQIQVETADTYYSNLEDFTVSDADRPSICSIAPSCDNSAGQSSTITGKKFGTTGTVKYGTNTGTTTAWEDTSIAATAPSSLTQDTYQVTVTANSETSNSVDYSIPCSEAPEVVESATCNATSKIFPLPNPQPNEESACINSNVGVMFDKDMDDATFTTSTLTLVECNTDDGTNTFTSASCGTNNIIQTADINTGVTVVYGSNTYYGFYLDPDDFTPNTWYQMTVGTGVQSTTGVGLAEAYTYHFMVRDSAEYCALASISVQPTTITQNAYCADLNADDDTSDTGECPRSDGDYTGSAYSAECLFLDSGSYDWSYTLTNPTGGDCTDLDDDGLNLTQETAAGTDSAVDDTDTDGYEDGWEIQEGTDPLLATSVPSTSGDLIASDICEDTETCVESSTGPWTCTSVVGDFSDSGAGTLTATTADVTVYPGGNDNENQGTADLDVEADGVTDAAEYTMDLGYCESDRDCELSCTGSTCDETINRCTPVVTDFSPASGELGTWVTINGCMFGPKKGNVQWEDGSTVIDTEWPDEALCGDTWSDTQIVAEFPSTYTASGATSESAVPTSSYAVNVINTYDLEDTTTSEFQVNTDVHAGLCRVNPDSEVQGGNITLSGQNFGEGEGLVSFSPDSGSTTYGSRVEADVDDTTWSDTSIDTVVPEGAYTGLSSVDNSSGDPEEGVKVILSGYTEESNALDFTVTYENPTVVSSSPEDGETDVCPNGTITIEFSEGMTGFSLGYSGTVHLYKVTTDSAGAETLTRVRQSAMGFEGYGVTLSPYSTLNTSTNYRAVLDSETSSEIRSSVSDLNVEGGDVEINFTTGSVICQPDHVNVTTTANELDENLDLDASGTIQDTNVEVSSWTYTAAGETRQWDAHMFDENDVELANVANLSWSWSWEPVYDETACTNAVWVSTVADDTDLDLLDDDTETALGTDPATYDTDEDGFGDGWEQEIGTDPLEQSSYPNETDSDSDGLLATEEIEWNTDYTDYDSDEDGFGDGWEVLNSFDPTDSSSFPTVTDPGVDADSDGLLEVSSATGAQEETTAGTTTTDNDTDDDTYLDGWEVLFSSDPTDSTSIPAIWDPGADSDGDGLGSLEETAEATTEGDYDTDEDGYGDGWEVENDTDPLDEESYPTEAESITGLDDSQQVIAGSEDDQTSSVAVTANALTGWTGSETSSSAVSVLFCDGDSWQYSDSTSQQLMLWFCDDNHTLPGLDGPAVTAGTDYIRQYLFPSDEDSNDTIGVRVYANSTDFLTPEEWVNENVPNAGDLSLSSTEVDGYPAVRSSNAVYVNASYIGSSNANYRIYNNIYLITWTQGGDAETIVSEILDHWQFNTNVDDSASTDTISGPDQGCVYSAKSKLQRDTERVVEINTISSSLADYYGDNSEFPLPKSDTLDSYIEHITNSVWPSWQGALGNVLGQALGEDPINAFIDGVDADGNAITDYLNADSSVECPYSPDTNQFYDTSGTCWDNVNLVFSCPDNSSVYLYKVDETDQNSSWLYGNMEYTPTSGSVTYYPTGTSTARYNTYQTTSTDYDPCVSSSSATSCSCFNFALNGAVNGSGDAVFSGGE